MNIPRLASSRISKSNSYYLSYKSLVPALQQALHHHAQGKLLDIGCGNKPYEALMPAAVTEYTGCDIDQSDLGKVDVLCPADAIPVPDASFDTVFSTQVLEHVANHGGMLSEAFRVLKPGGSLVLSCPMYWPLHEEPYDFFRFTKYGLMHLLEQKGFKEIEIMPCGGRWAVAGTMFLELLPLRPRLANRLLNPVFDWLDTRKADYSIVLNYVLTARKPA